MNKVSSTASVATGGNLSVEIRKVETSAGAKLLFSKGQGFLPMNADPESTKCVIGDFANQESSHVSKDPQFHKDAIFFSHHSSVIRQGQR